MALPLTILSAQANSEEPVDPAKLAELKAAHPAWPMHKIDNTLWNHNSLSPGDVNRDGFTDYAVMHEGAGKFTFLLHPGSAGDVRKPWQKVILGEGPNPEYSDFGDFDGDGNLDIVGASGRRSGATSGSTGINILWGPETNRVTASDSWLDAGLIPATKDRGHFLYVQSHDVNRDGAMDIVAGGRVLGTHSLADMTGKKTAGIAWIESPADQAARRDLSKWTIHYIDPLTAGGHGFIFVDVDRDDDEDIAASNAVPTPEEIRGLPVLTGNFVSISLIGTVNDECLKFTIGYGVFLLPRCVFGMVHWLPILLPICYQSPLGLGFTVVADHMSIKQVFEEYFAAYTVSKEEATVNGERIHTGHFVRILKENTGFADLDLDALQTYAAKRCKEKGLRGRKLSPETIKKEFRTFDQIWKMAVAELAAGWRVCSYVA